jgi:hypothetical protein
MQSRYLVADREQKAEILDGFVAAIGYHRKYAASVLASTLAGVPANGKRIRTRKYDTEVRIALISVWNAANQITVRRRLSGWRRESMIANLPEYTSDTRYDALAFSDSLQNLSQKALNLQSV